MGELDVVSRQAVAGKARAEATASTLAASGERCRRAASRLSLDASALRSLLPSFSVWGLGFRVSPPAASPSTPPPSGFFFFSFSSSSFFSV